MRFAICVSGDLRGFTGVAWTLVERLILPTKRGGANVDLFAHVWSDGTPQQAAGVDLLHGLKEHGLVQAVVESRYAWRNITQSTYGWPEGAGTTTLQFRSQWRKVHLCLRLATEHADRKAWRILAGGGSVYYDAYVRTRADMLYLAPLDLGREHARWVARPEALDRGVEYLASFACSSSGAVSDQWLVATRRAAEAYAALPRVDEPGTCCEDWLAQRLSRLGIAEFPMDEEVPAHAAACAPQHGQHSLAKGGGASKPGVAGSPFIWAAPPLFLGLPYGVVLGKPCASRLERPAAVDNPACGRDLTAPPWADGFVAHVRMPTRFAAAAGKAPWLALRRLLEGQSSLDRFHQQVRLKACRCAGGAARPAVEENVTTS